MGISKKWFSFFSSREESQQKEYSKKDLISFGNYLLSETRSNRIKSKENLNRVGDWDIENWANK